MTSILLNKKIALGLGAIILAAGVYFVSSTGAFFSDTETSNGNSFVAGAIDLKVDSTSHYNGMICANNTGISAGYFWIPEGQVAADFDSADATAFNAGHPGQYPLAGSSCSGTWTLKDLEPTLDKFFNFADVKPGDRGENTVSLHIDNNDAYACVDISNVQNNDNTQTEPEALVDGNALVTGEMAQNLNFIVWKDDGATDGWQCGDSGAMCEADPTEGDNIWQQGEDMLTAGTAPTANQSYTLANSITGPLTGGATGYVGVEWCAGTWSSNTPGATCSGASMGNDVQTDSYSADVSFRVEQARNNPNFSCTPQEQVVTHLTLAKTVLPALLHPDSAYTLTASSTNSVTLVSGIEGAGTVTGAVVTPGIYNLSESSAFPGAVVAWSCIGNATPEIDNGNGTATVTIAAGENVGCEVTNSYPPQQPE